MIRSLLVLVFIGGVFYANGQDALFSQLMNNKNLLNPSLMALQNSPFEISVSFREQAGVVSNGLPLTTFQAVANFNSTSREVDKISYGVSAFSDKGGLGHLGTNLFHGNFAYLKKLTGRYSKVGAQYLSIGTSIGLGQRSITGNRFWFGNQFDTGSFQIDNSLESGEETFVNGNGQSGLLTDINVGLTWYASLNEDLALQAGASVFHVDRSNISVLEGAVERNQMRYNAHFQLSTEVYDNVSVQPQVVYMRQGWAYQLLLGSDVEIDNLDDNELIMKFGVFTRVVNGFNHAAFESVILTLNTIYNGIKFGFGYDFTTSSMSAFNNGRGAWEVNLGYFIKSSDKNGYSRKKERFKF